QGEVKLADGTPYVDMGTIKVASPMPVTFTLESEDPQLELSLADDQLLDFLGVELLDSKNDQNAAGRKTWRIRVQFKTDSLFRGTFPDPERPGYDSDASCTIAFVLSRKGQPWRRLLVPVRGTVPIGQ